jgi:indolepyruvate ferredoxin oxidoreductase, beta subunit
MKTYGMILCGVGGQGLVLLSRTIGTACAMAGVRIVTGEQHGLSQRSGSVSIHLRMGEAAVSPLVPAGTADAILSLEGLESIRYIEFLRRGGTVLTSSLVMHPVTETAAITAKKASGYTGMPEVEAALAESGARLVSIDARDIASSLGSPMAENMVMLGVLSSLEGFPLGRPVLTGAIREVSPPSALPVNLAAFESGSAAAG